MIARMEMDYQMDFWKPVSVNFFQIFKFGTEIIEIYKIVGTLLIFSWNCFLTFS